MKAHIKFSEMHSYCCHAQDPSLIADPLHLLNYWFLECFKSAIIKENAAAGQQVSLLQLVKGNPETIQLWLGKQLFFPCDVTKELLSVTCCENAFACQC